MKRWLTIALSIGNLTLAQTQFEVASVKVNRNGTGYSGGCHGTDSKYTAGEVAAAPPLGRCVITAARLSHMIGIAWQLPMNELKGGPDWVMRGFDRFNIEAEADDPAKTTEAQLRSMLQAMLIDRFQLKFHRETVERPGFALIVGEKGPRLSPSKSQDSAVSFGNQVKPMPGQPATLTARRLSMAQLASMISNVLLQPVIDETKLSAEYDFQLHWDQEQGPTIETALREQLGLKLDPRKLPVELFVIDSAQKPSAN